MKLTKILIIVLLPVLIVGLLLNFVFFKSEEGKSSLPVDIPTQSKDCGIENCHGLDVKCGSDIVDVCTMEFESGDSCRKYAKCIVIDGVCQVEMGGEYSKCKKCIEECWEEKGERSMICDETCGY